MTIALQPFADLDTVAVAQNLTEVLARVQEDNPSLDLRVGPFADILARYHALLETQFQGNLADYLNARSLLIINQNPATADPALVDDVLSNFTIIRNPGTIAVGEVTVIVSTNLTVTIAQGAIWQANGQQFVTQNVFTAKAEAGQINSENDRLLTATTDSNYAFTIEVVATESGPVNVPKDTLVAPLVVPSNYVNSFAASDFSGGVAPQTNQDLLNRLQEGVAAKGLGGRVNMAATLHAVTEFADVPGLSVIGMGDPEQLRDKHTIFPVAIGGRVDWYVRSQAAYLNQGLTKLATLVDFDADGAGVWQVAITRDDAPGFYEVSSVLPTGSPDLSGSCTILTDTRANDLTGLPYVPDIVSVEEGAYTRFQTTVLRFSDQDTSAASFALNDTRSYELTVRMMPLIGDIQDTMLLPDFRARPYDLLVKAPVPCFVRLTFKIFKQAGDADPDLAAITTGLCDAVNNVGFIGRLYASRLSDVVQARLINAISVGAIDMFGRIRYPDGSNKYLRSSEVLTVPDDTGKMVSSKTVQFFTVPDDVSITVLTAVPSN